MDSLLKSDKNIDTMSMFGSVNGAAKKEKEDLRKIFTDKFGVRMEFPAYYNYKAVFVPHYEGLIISFGFHCIPKSY